MLRGEVYFIVNERVDYFCVGEHTWDKGVRVGGGLGMGWWYLLLFALGSSCRVYEDVFSCKMFQGHVRAFMKKELWKEIEWVRMVCLLHKRVMIISARRNWLEEDFHWVKWSLTVRSLLWNAIDDSRGLEYIYWNIVLGNFFFLYLLPVLRMKSTALWATILQCARIQTSVTQQICGLKM